MTSGRGGGGAHTVPPHSEAPRWGGVTPHSLFACSVFAVGAHSTAQPHELQSPTNTTARPPREGLHAAGGGFPPTLPSASPNTPTLRAEPAEPAAAGRGLGLRFTPRSRRLALNMPSLVLSSCTMPGPPEPRTAHRRAVVQHGCSPSVVWQWEPGAARSSSTQTLPAGHCLSACPSKGKISFFKAAATETPSCSGLVKPCASHRGSRLSGVVKPQIFARALGVLLSTEEGQQEHRVGSRAAPCRHQQQPSPAPRRPHCRSAMETLLPRRGSKPTLCFPSEKSKALPRASGCRRPPASPGWFAGAERHLGQKGGCANGLESAAGSVLGCWGGDRARGMGAARTAAQQQSLHRRRAAKTKWKPR